MAIEGRGLPIVRTHALPLLRDVWDFVRHPTMPETKLAPGRDFAIVLLLLLLLDLALAASSEALLWTAQGLGYEAPAPYDLDLSSPINWLLLVVLAPLTEEPLFRGFLSGRIAALRFAALSSIGLMMIFASMAIYGEHSGGRLALAGASAGAAIIFISFLHWLHTRESATSIPTWFRRSFGWFVWLSALAFGLVHLANYENSLGPWDSILVLSQAAGGLVLAYTRTRLGMLAAIAQHSLFNLFVTVLYEPGVFAV
jgi:membrane protease YdiL (CAAX protease family)